MRLMRAFAAATLTWVLVSSSSAAQDTLERQLTDQYRDKVLALRHSFKSNSQEYAADGTPLNTAEEGAWTIYGRILVKSIKVYRDRTTIEGTRALYLFDKSGIATQFQDDSKHPAEKLKVTIRLDQSIFSAEDASAVLGRIFALRPDDILNSAPVYWRSQLAQQMGLKSAATDAGKQNRDTNQAPGQMAAIDDHSVLHLGDPGVKPPKVIYKGEPGFTDVARKRLVQGVVGLQLVIDPAGKVRNISIVRPLGMGLDDNAVAMAGTWRFVPATKDGQPVAVAVYVEVDFRLY